MMVYHPDAKEATSHLTDVAPTDRDKELSALVELADRLEVQMVCGRLEAEVVDVAGAVRVLTSV